jgi:hypothetical protein
MLPPRYSDWITNLLGGTLPEEQVATCDRCVMQTSDVPEAYRFRADAKCCTYVPALPNFLVGAALRDLPPGPARVSLERRLAEPAVCTPHGLDVGEDERRRYHAIVSAETFGRDPGLRCPHYLAESGGQCGIWRHRNGVCATWFCKHERGATSQRFWQALEGLLTLVERELSHWCACQLLYHTEPPGPPGGDDELPEWAAWLPHLDDYYRRCAALVDELEWPEVQAIASPDFIPAAARLQAAYAALQPLPGPALVQIRRPLLPGPVRVSHRDPAHTRIVTYSDSDPLELPTAIVDLLPRFDGRPTGQVLDELEREGVVLAPDLLALLLDFEVLQPS